VRSRTIRHVFSRPFPGDEHLSEVFSRLFRRRRAPIRVSGMPPHLFPCWLYETDHPKP
jgi:hypothetical protein